MERRTCACFGHSLGTSNYIAFYSILDAVYRPAERRAARPLRHGSRNGGAASPAPVAERKVLYYRDPKDPNYKAQQPGLNPDTGNQLQPVYADDVSTMPVGTVQITPEKQQLIGV